MHEFEEELGKQYRNQDRHQADEKPMVDAATIFIFKMEDPSNGHGVDLTVKHLKLIGYRCGCWEWHEESEHKDLRKDDHSASPDDEFGIHGLLDYSFDYEEAALVLKGVANGGHGKEEIFVLNFQGAIHEECFVCISPYIGSHWDNKN